jgi:hypothetical protein
VAQCQGRTRKGAQCKRDASEGSAFCTIHVDQAVRAPSAKEAVEWDRDAVMKAALGLALVGAILFFRLRR